MEKGALLAIEFYAFMALAAWLVYRQFIAARRDRSHREKGDESKEREGREDH